MNIKNFRKLNNLKESDVFYDKERDCVDFAHNIDLTFDLIQKTKEFFKFDNCITHDNSIFKIPKSEILKKISDLLGEIKIDFPARKIELITLSGGISSKEILELRKLLKKEFEIHHFDSKLEIKWYRNK